MHGFVGVTGTPGTGKKTVAPLLGGVLRMPVFGLNELALEGGLARGRGHEVDAPKLHALVRRACPVPSVIYGHLLPSVLQPDEVEAVVVLRCDPATLKSRLEERGYDRGKVLDNVESELIGLLYSESVQRFGPRRVIQLDTSKRTAADSAVSAAVLLSRRARGGEPVDWLADYASAEKLRSLLSAE